jgi:outer membrane protein OmpA-like peptidoglycan-associated protein
VQAEWLEPEPVPVPRPSPRSRPQRRPPPLPPSARDPHDDSQHALQRLLALHPARTNEKTLDDLGRRLKKVIPGGSFKITTRHGNVVVEIEINTLFAAGESGVKPSAARTLAELASALSATGAERIQVEVHAAAKASAWRLGTTQAMEVATRLAHGGIPEHAICVAAFGELGAEARAERTERSIIAITILRQAAGGVDNR